MIFLGIISILVILGLPIAAIVMASRTRKQLDALEHKIAGMQATLAGWSPGSSRPAGRVQPKKTTTDKVSQDLPQPDKSARQPKKVTRSAGQSPPAKPAKNKPARDLETLIGARWSVLLGGFTLALGIVFLVRYSIEAGLLGPKTRILLGALFSAALLAGGEWLRRQDKKLSLPVIERADIPGILTGAGVIGAFATLYAAHALYGYIGPATAFVALTVIGLASLVLSALHGPALAAIGILGAYATPLLVSSNQPNSLALALHVLVVTCAVMTVARMRGWLWLALAGVVASCLWTMLTALSFDVYAGVGGLILVCGLALVFAAVFGFQAAERPEPLEDRKADRTTLISFALLTLAFLVQLAANDALPDVAAGMITALIFIAAAGVWPTIASISVMAGLIVVATIATSNLPWTIVDGLTQTSDIRHGLIPADTVTFARNALFVALPPAALAVWGSWRSAATAPKMSAWLAVTAGAIGFFGLVVAYLRIAPFETRPAFGAMALALAVISVALTQAFTLIRLGDMRAPAPAAYAVAAVASVSFAIAVSLDVGWMPLAFSLTGLGIAAIFTQRPVKLLPWLALAAAVLGVITLWFNLPFELPDVGETLIFNQLLVLLGLPAAVLVAGGELLRRFEVEKPSVGVTSLGLAVAGLFIGLEIVHFINGGNLQTAVFSLAELSGQTLAALGFAIGLQRIAKIAGATIYDWASLAAGAISVAYIAFGLLMFLNPAFTNDPVGTGFIFNLLLPGYLLTGLVAAVVAWLSRPLRPRWYTLGYAALSGLLLFTYFTLMLRKGFHGDRLGLHLVTTDIELWYYSLLWLVMGGALLALGLKLRSAPIRAASGILIALTICKVFLLDMSSLTGALRAFSFIGLGISLLIIGRIYQHLLGGIMAKPQKS